MKCLERLNHRGVCGMDVIVYCDTCETVKKKREFSEDMLQRWRILDDANPIQCKKCTR